MDKITKQDIIRMAEMQNEYVVSIYQPTQKKVSGRQIKQDPTRFKNLLEYSRGLLESLGVDKRDVSKQLKPGKNLLKDDVFWHHQDHGLAAFFSSSQSHIYRLPFSFDVIAVAAKGFHIKQLLHMLSDREYYVLALSPKNVRLYHANVGDIQRLDNENEKGHGIPNNITEALGEDEDEDRQLQHHVAGGAIFHGHGDPNEYKQVDVRRFVQEVANSVSRKLSNVRAPLILATVDELATLYKEAYTNHNLHEVHLSGNHDEIDDQQLHEKSWPILQAEFDQEKANELQRFRALQSSDPEKVSVNLENIISFAHQGRVETLLVNKKPVCWGEAEEGHVKRHEHEEIAGLMDLSDIAARYALKMDSSIYLVDEDELPPDTPAVATLRY